TARPSAPPHENGGAAWPRPRDVGLVCSALQGLVDQLDGLVLAAVAGEDQLGDQDLAGALQHALLAGRQALLPVPHGEVADHLGDLEDVARLEALDVALEAPAPVALGGGLAGAQDVHHAFDVLGAADLADADLLTALTGDHEGQVAVGQLQDEVLAGLATHLAVLQALDRGRAVLRVDDAVPDSEHTWKPLLVSDTGSSRPTPICYHSEMSQNKRIRR